MRAGDGSPDSVKIARLTGQRKTLVRVVLAALALCALSFAAGVAGDLSLASSGPAATATIPADAPRAGPLPPPRTAAAAAAPAPESRRIAPREKPRALRAKGEIKRDPDRAPKASRTK